MLTCNAIDHETCQVLLSSMPRHSHHVVASVSTLLVAHVIHMILCCILSNEQIFEVQIR